MSEQMYMENILDHYKKPHNFKRLEGAQIQFKEYNPLCGDIIELFVNLDKGKVVEAAFSGTGCAISQASASMLTDWLQGKSLEEVKGLTQEKILEMLGIEVSVLRLKCALLSLKALERGVYLYEGRTQ